MFPKGRKIISFDELIRNKIDALNAYEVPGRMPRRFFIQSSSLRGGLLRLAEAAGVNSLYATVDPAVYGNDSKLPGWNRTRAFATVQNAHLNRACYEGDFTALEKRYVKLRDTLKAAGVGHVPLEFKLIEEAGPPALAILRTWPKMNEQFRAYLRKAKVDPTEVLPHETLQKLLAEKTRPTDAALWELVTLGTGTFAESLSDPALFYHSQIFRSELMARTCAAATRLLEKTFGPGTLVSSGSFYPSTGATPTMTRGDDPFMLFRERGVTSYSSEISWGWGGTPDFIGPRVASYEAALARALGKYHKCPRGSYLIADPNRGYDGNFVETYSYGLLAGVFFRMEYFFIGYPGECSAVASSDIQKAIKKVSYQVGAIEDRLLDSAVVPAKVAIGWSVTTDVWELSTPPKDRREVLNNMYPQERCLLYMMLRHCQVPVDLLGEGDLTAGSLKQYAVYVLVGDHLRPESAQALADWVKAGGTLISVAGGGLRDHYDRPLPTLLDVFGIDAAPLEKRQTCLRPKLELLHTAPLDEIRFTGKGLEGGAMKVFGFRQMITARKGTEVFGTFMNGRPGITRNRFGKGQAVLIGALAGLPYVAPGIPLLPFGRGGTDNPVELHPDEIQRPDPRPLRVDPRRGGRGAAGGLLQPAGRGDAAREQGREGPLPGGRELRHEAGAEPDRHAERPGRMGARGGRAGGQERGRLDGPERAAGEVQIHCAAAEVSVSSASMLWVRTR